MLKGTSFAYTSVRRISFFVPSTRLNEFKKRQLQNNASFENFEKNFIELDQYANNLLNKKESSSNDFSVVLNGGPKIADFKFNNNSDVLAKSLDSINIDFLKNDPFTLIESTNSSNINKLIKNIKYLICTSDIRDLYNYLKLNISQISKLNQNLSTLEISIIIKKLIIYNNSISHRVKFLTKNKNYLENNSDYIKKLNIIYRSVYITTKSIFNSLMNSNILTHYDYTNLITFYYGRNQIKKTIDLIALYEKKCLDDPIKYHLTNQIWAIKMDILSQTNINFWKLYGQTIFKINSNSNSIKLSHKYLYPHHGHNFQTLIKRYESEQQLNQLPENISILSIIIKGLGKHGDIKSLDKIIENNWGIKIDRENNNEIYLLKHFNINKKVNQLLWPDEDILISILLAYTKNGYLSNAIEINNLLINNYSNYHLFNTNNINKYWKLLLYSTGKYGDAVNKQLIDEINGSNIPISDKLGNSLIEIKYRFFDIVWKLCEKYIDNDIISRDLIELKIKYSSSHELLNNLPKVYQKINNLSYNKMILNMKFNQMTLQKYVRECCLELANRGKFLDANQLIEKYIKSKESMSELKVMLTEMQEAYARERVKSEERKRKSIDDDDDFELW